MKKSNRGEVVLSSCQIQATRLNKLEYHRLQRNVTFLRENLQEHLARINRQEQGLKLHFNNVVKVIKPNRAYQLWKQAHAEEIARDEAIELFKRQRKLQSKSCTQISTSSNEIPSEPLRPLLLLLEDPSKKPVEPIINLSEIFLRPKTSPINKQSSSPHRFNPLLNMLDGKSTSSNNISQQPPPTPTHRVNPLLNMLSGRPASSNVYRQQQPQQYDSPSFYSLSSTGTPGSRKLVQGKFIVTHKKSDLDAFYRMALQNQTAYKSVDQTVVENRKLHDKEFASRHRALKGSMRSSGLVN